MNDEVALLKSRLERAEAVAEQVLEENRQWRVAVISRLESNQSLAEQIFELVRGGGLPDEFIECHLHQVIKDRDRWKSRALEAESRLRSSSSSEK